MAAAGDLTQWRRENSNAVPIVVVMADGSEVRGTMLVPRDRSLRDFMCEPLAFIEVECQIKGSMLVSKAMVRTIRAVEIPRADHLDLSLKALEKMDVYGILKIAKTATAEEVRIAARDQTKRFPIPLGGTSVLPKEVLDYIHTMRQRIELAKTELLAALTAAAEKSAQKEANTKAMQRAPVPRARPAA